MKNIVYTPQEYKELCDKVYELQRQKQDLVEKACCWLKDRAAIVHTTVGNADRTYFTEDSFVDGYIEGATEQQAIDINNACEYCENNWEQYFKSRSDMKCFKGWLRKAMTASIDPLFEECLAMVDPEIRAEVRANMGKED